VSLGKVGLAFTSVAVALIIIANAPAMLLDPVFLAVAQIRANAAKTAPAVVTLEPIAKAVSPVETSAQKTE